MRNAAILFLLLAATAAIPSPVRAQGKLPQIPSIPTVNVPIPPTPPQVRLPELYRRFAGIPEPDYRDFQNGEKEKESLEETIEKLLEEFGPNAKYGVTEHFVYIYDTTDSYAKWVALLCERVESTYEKFVRYMGVGREELTDPMIVLVFTNKEDYEAYATRVFSEFAGRKNKPIGFYSSGSNRSAFFDMTLKERNIVEEPKEKKTLEEIATEIVTRPEGLETLSVVVHETTHQVSANRGLFARFSKNPDWANEGLAMLFEAPVGEAKDGGWKVTTDFGPNLRRIREFQQFARSSTENPLRRVVSSESINGDVPGSYEASWALFSYLYKKHPKRLAGYLYHTASQRRSSYPALTRINEFETFFTDDWDRLYQEVRAFVDELEKNPYSFLPQPPKEEDEKKDKKSKKEEEKKEEKGADAPEANEKNPEKPNENPEPNRAEPAKTDPDAPKVALPKPEEHEKSGVANEPPESESESERVVVEGLEFDGKTFDPTDLEGKRFLLVFFAAWQKRSVDDVELLAREAERLRSKGVEIVAYSLDDDLDALAEFVKKRKLPFPVLSQYLSCESEGARFGDLSERYGNFSANCAVLVDKDGKILEKKLAGKELERKLSEL